MIGEGKKEGGDVGTSFPVGFKESVCSRGLKLCQRSFLSLQFRGKLPPPCDPVCKIIDWILAVWHQLNSCLSRLGAPEALMGPKHFFSCPVVPGHGQATVK